MGHITWQMTHGMWHVMGRRKTCTGFLAIVGGILKKSSHLEDPGVDGKIIFSTDLVKHRKRGSGLGSSGVVLGQVESSREGCNKPLNSIKCGEFLDW